MDLSDVTFCSGLWLLENNPKHDAGHYYGKLRPTIEMIKGGNLVFFHDNKNVMAEVQEVCDENNIDVIGINCQVEELPAYNYTKAFMDSLSRYDCSDISDKREKGFRHYHYHYKMGGEFVYQRMIAIWMSKVMLINETLIPGNYFSASNFCWIDASFSRINGQRSKSKFVDIKFNDSKISGYASPMKYYGVKLPISAGFLYGGCVSWRTLSKSYQYYLEALPEISNYAHDEETILFYCFKDSPRLFERIGFPTGRKQKIIKNQLSRAREKIRLRVPDLY